jgi:hypothetical protein
MSLVPLEPGAKPPTTCDNRAKGCPCPEGECEGWRGSVALQPQDDRDPKVCTKCGGYGGGPWNGSNSPTEGYLPCYACGQ